VPSLSPQLRKEKRRQAQPKLFRFEAPPITALKSGLITGINFAGLADHISLQKG
jgi:hypothetical protein